MEKRQRAAAVQLILYGELILALLILTAAGAKLYGSALMAREAHSHQRLALSYLQSQALGVSSILTAPGPEGDMLVLRETDEAYETRIYVCQGNLCSAFSPVGSALAQKNSQIICPLKELTLCWESPTQLRVTADGMEGTICSRGGWSNDG